MVAGGDGEPCHAAENVGEVDVGEPVVGSLGYGIESAGEGEEHREGGGDGEKQRAVGETVFALEVDGERDGGEAVGGEEAVDGEGAHPAVDVGAGDSAECEDDDGECGEEAGDEDSRGRRGVSVVGSTEAVVDETVVAHAHEDSGSGGDAGECAGEHADERTEVDERAEEFDAGEGGEDTHRSGRFAEILVRGVHAEGFEVGAENEEEASEDGALNDGARDGAERIGGFGAEGGGAFETDETEDREDDTETDSGGSDSLQVCLGVVEMQAVVPEQKGEDDGDEGDRGGLDPKHEAGGDLDVTIGDEGGDSDTEDCEECGWRGFAEE